MHLSNIVHNILTATEALDIGLDFSNIGDEGAIRIAQALQNANAPIKISLNYCDIGHRGAIRMAHILRNTRVPIKIYLEGNDIGIEIPPQMPLLYAHVIEYETNVINAAKENNIATMSHKIFSDNLHRTYNIHNAGFLYAVDNNLPTITSEIYPIIFSYLESRPYEFLHCTNLKFIHYNNAVVDNKIYTIDYLQLGLSLKTSCEGNPWFLTYRKIDQYVFKIFRPLISISQKVRMEKVAQKYGYKVNTLFEETKGTFLKLAKVMHPDKGGNHDAFIEINDIYKEDASASLVVLTQQGLDILHSVTIWIYSVNLGVSTTKTVCNFNSDNSINLAKDTILALGILCRNSPLIMSATLMDISYKLYKGDSEAAIHDTCAAIALNFIVFPLFIYFPTAAFIATTVSILDGIYKTAFNICDTYVECFCDETSTHAQDNQTLIHTSGNITSDYSEI